MRAAYAYKDRGLDTLRRYRSVATIVAIPVSLILAILLLLPHGGQHKPGGFTRSQPFMKEDYQRKESSTSRFAIVLDAGSTGSRIHVFKFKTGSSDQVLLQFDRFDQLKPGLSSYAHNPAAAALSLKPLLELALNTVPKELHAATPLMLGATAGLRLLPDGKADEILAEVRRWVRANYPFKFQDDDVNILSGVDEGAFAWLTLNYLLGRLGRPHSETVAAIDLGGGSVQEAFAMSSSEARNAPHADYITKLRGGGQQYSVYVYSYLGYGLMAGRAAVLSEDPNGPEDPTHPCVHKGYDGTYEYGGKTLVAVGHSEGAAHDQCAATVIAALRQAEECGAPKLQCSFGGAWGGPRIPDLFYVSSYFWDRAAEAGIVDGSSALQAAVKPLHFKDAAQKVCSLDVEGVGSKFPEVQEAHRPYFCLDLTYAHTLLTSGFKIPESKEVTLVRKVEYQGELIEAAWPLGAAINMLG